VYGFFKNFRLYPQTTQRSVRAWVDKTVKLMLYNFFWVIPRRLRFKCRRFGTLCLFHLHRQVLACEDGTECSETSTFKTQTPGNYAKEIIQHSKHGESLKSSKTHVNIRTRSS
jgi:hypothetical protein